jgi:hypothetical protein
MSFFKLPLEIRSNIYDQLRLSELKRIIREDENPFRDDISEYCMRYRTFDFHLNQLRHLCCHGKIQMQFPWSLQYGWHPPSCSTDEEIEQFYDWQDENWDVDGERADDFSSRYSGFLDLGRFRNMRKVHLVNDAPYPPPFPKEQWTYLGDELPESWNRRPDLRDRLLWIISRMMDLLPFLEVLFIGQLACHWGYIMHNLPSRVVRIHRNKHSGSKQWSFDTDPRFEAYTRCDYANRERLYGHLNIPFTRGPLYLIYTWFSATKLLSDSMALVRSYGLDQADYDASTDLCIPNPSDFRECVDLLISDTRSERSCDYNKCIKSYTTWIPWIVHAVGMDRTKDLIDWEDSAYKILRDEMGKCGTKEYVRFKMQLQKDLEGYCWFPRERSAMTIDPRRSPTEYFPIVDHFPYAEDVLEMVHSRSKCIKLPEEPRYDWSDMKERWILKPKFNE